MSIYIISAIVALLVLLISYVFISNTLEKRRVQRQRLITALKIRERNFRYMITGLPAHFLPVDLSTLVYRALIETCEQLAKLDPREPSHQADAILFSSQLAAAKHTQTNTRVHLENPAQVKEVRQHLQELIRFVAQQEARKLINGVQAAAYADQIKRLAIQTSVDGYVSQAKVAQQSGKFRLAVHFFTLARKLLVSENAAHHYDKQIGQLQAVITKLEESAAQSAVPGDASPEEFPDPQINKEWEHFGDDEWRKKQVYD
jgi:hypothetical protein